VLQSDWQDLEAIIGKPNKGMCIEQQFYELPLSQKSSDSGSLKLSAPVGQRFRVHVGALFQEAVFVQSLIR
jgi:hypothetical protein